MRLCVDTNPGMCKYIDTNTEQMMTDRTATVDLEELVSQAWFAGRGREIQVRVYATNCMPIELAPDYR